MTKDERKRRFAKILDEHDRAVRAYNEATFANTIDGMKRAINGMLTAVEGLEQARAAQKIAVDAMLVANRESLAFFNAEEDES